MYLDACVVDPGPAPSGMSSTTGHPAGPLLIRDGRHSADDAVHDARERAAWASLTITRCPLERGPRAPLSTDTIAYVQVAAVVFGHVLGVILSHEQALRSTRRTRASDQLPLVVVMVAFPVFGLGLLFGF